MLRNEIALIIFLRGINRQRNGCWIWPKAKMKKYRTISIRGKQFYGHRMVKYLDQTLNWEQLNNPKIVCRHNCDDSRCQNPDHIEIGTQSDNVRDRVIRDRTRKGDTHPVAKLTAVDIRIIRKLLDRGNLQKQEIAKMFNVSPANIWAIRTGYSWKHIK